MGIKKGTHPARGPEIAWQADACSKNLPRRASILSLLQKSPVVRWLARDSYSKGDILSPPSTDYSCLVLSPPPMCLVFIFGILVVSCPHPPWDSALSVLLFYCRSPRLCLMVIGTIGPLLSLMLPISYVSFLVNQSVSTFLLWKCPPPDWLSSSPLSFYGRYLLLIGFTNPHYLP